MNLQMLIAVISQQRNSLFDGMANLTVEIQELNIKIKELEAENASLREATAGKVEFHPKQRGRVSHEQINGA